MNVHVGTANPLKIAATRAAFAKAFPDRKLNVTGIKVSPGVPPQPAGEEVTAGAIQRARSAQMGAEFGVGIEAGILRLPGLDRYLNMQVCAIVDRAGKLSIGSGPGFELPPSVLERLLHGTTLNHEMSRISGIDEIKEKIGAVGYLSAGRTNRFTVTYMTVLMALIPYIRRDLFAE